MPTTSYLVVILCMSVHFATSDSNVCDVEQRMDVALDRLEDPARILNVGYDSATAEDCYRKCCNYTDVCNAVSFYPVDGMYVCVLLSCHPFKNCFWKSLQNFVAGRVKLVAAQPQPISDQGLATTLSITSLVTSAVAPSSAALAVTTVQTTAAQAFTNASLPDVPQPQENFDPNYQDWNVDADQPWIDQQQTTVNQNVVEQGDYFVQNQTEQLSNETEKTDGGPDGEEPWNINTSALAGGSTVTSPTSSNNTGQTDSAGMTDNDGMTDNGGEIDDNLWNIEPSFLNGSDIRQTTVLDNGGQRVATDNGQPNGAISDNDEDYDQFWNIDDTDQLAGKETAGDTTTDFVLDDDSLRPGFQDEGLNTPSNAAGFPEPQPNFEQPQPEPPVDQPIEEPFPDVFGPESDPPQPVDQPEPPVETPEQPVDQQLEESFPDVFGPESNPNDWPLPNPDSNPDFGSDDTGVSQTRPEVQRPSIFQSPGVIIGLCSALGVSFLVLLAVCRKVYQGDRPRYKQLRDYDVHFEPPAASSALLP